MKNKTIKISDELYGFLTKKAIRKADTYDEIIKRLLRNYMGVSIEPDNIREEKEEFPLQRRWRDDGKTLDSDRDI